MNPVQQYSTKLISEGRRLDGRKFDQYRDIVIEKGLVGPADGSARVRFGNCEVIAGVKLSVGTPFPDTPDKGALMIEVEFLPLSSQEYESGPPSIDSIEVSRVVDKCIRESECINMKDLCIEEGEKVWILSIDIVPINSDGDLFDISSLATLIALENTRFPALKNGVVDYKAESTKNKFSLLQKPILVTVYKIGNEFLVDITADEKKLVDARLGVTVLEDESICALQKGGDVALSSEDIDKMLSLALNKAKELRERL